MSFKELAKIIWEDIKEHSNLVAKKIGDQPWKEEDNFRKEYPLDVAQSVVITYDGKQHTASPLNIPHCTRTAETVQEIEEFLNEYMLLKERLPEEETEVDVGSMKVQLRKLQEEQGITPEVIKRIVSKHLKELREAFYQAVLQELSEKKARALVDAIFGWID